jgi:hypothetical protein
LLVIGLLALIVLAAWVVWDMNRPIGLPETEGVSVAADIGKPRVIAQTFQGCPPSGSGGDPVLNTLKNRIDEGNWQPVSVASILALDWPEAIENKPRSRWSESDTEEVARHEGTPVQVEGYLVRAKRMSPETCNCRSVDHVDFHIWMVDDPTKAREQSLVIETTPRVMFHHPMWTLRRIQQLASTGEKVRISGWLLMDPEHPDQIGKTRGSIWEIHPVMQIETLSNGAWRPLDNGTTGVRSSPAVAETIPPVTPASTATSPARANPDVQDNRTVRISTINFDGAGSNEPDEYVEIVNEGPEPVDITDWSLQDEGARNVFKWESYTLQPGASIRVYSNQVHNGSGGFSFGSGRAIWGNGGDVAWLYDADKIEVSRYAYGDKR